MHRFTLPSVVRFAFLLAFSLLCSTARAEILGFNSGIGWETNENAFFYNSDLFITTVGSGARNSAFYTTPQPISQFVAKFTYIDVVNGNNGLNAGNGATFTLHNDSDGAAAVGSGGGSGLGYQGITPSVALEINIDSIFTPPVGLGLGTNGVIDPNFIPTGAVDLRSAHPIEFTLTYDGTTLKTDLLDLVAGTSYTRSFTVDLVGIIGPNAYVGFTGGAGLDTATQVFIDFSFRQVPEPSTLVLGGLGLAAIIVAARRRR
jgi:hypothetical protein